MKRKAIINHIKEQLDDIECYLDRSALSSEMKRELIGERWAYSDVLGLLEAPKAPKEPKAPALTVEGAAALTKFIERETTSEQRLGYAGGWDSYENKAFYEALGVLYKMVYAR